MAADMAHKLKTVAAVLVAAPCAVASCNALVGAPDAVAAFDDASGTNAPDVGDARPADAGDEDDGPAACCSTGCTDLSTDPRNCGTCGHDCVFARCMNSVCEPITIAGSPLDDRGLRSLYGLTLLGGKLYGTNWYRSFAAVYTVSPDVSVSDPTPLVTYEAGISASPIANDGATLFYAIWQDEHPPIPGGAAGIYALDTSGHQQLVVRAEVVGSVAVDDNYLYWSVGNTISVAQKDGGGAAAFSTGATPNSAITAAPGWPWVYFVQDGALVRASPPGLDSVTSISGSDHAVAAYALDDASAYWVDRADAQAPRLFRASVTAPGQPIDITPRARLADQPNINLLADPGSADLFYRAGDAFSAKIYRLKKDGSQDPVVLVAFDDPIDGWTQDATRLFFTTYGNDTAGVAPFAAIWKVEK
jgi:hypothetical protein